MNVPFTAVCVSLPGCVFKVTRQRARYLELIELCQEVHLFGRSACTWMKGLEVVPYHVIVLTSSRRFRP